VNPAPRLSQHRSPAPPTDPLGPALALCVAGGMSEVEAIRSLHVRLLGRAAALGLRLYGELE